MIILSAIRLKQDTNLRTIEKAEMWKRIKFAALLYLVRDPIYENFTKISLERVFGILRISPKILAFLLAGVNYSRYYTYIAWKNAVNL